MIVFIEIPLIQVGQIRRFVCRTKGEAVRWLSGNGFLPKGGKRSSNKWWFPIYNHKLPGDHRNPNYLGIGRRCEICHQINIAGTVKIVPVDLVDQFEMCDDAGTSRSKLLKLMKKKQK